MKNRVDKICQNCGVEYQKYLSQAKGSKYCSRSCRWLAQKQKTGESNPCWRGGPVDKVCEICGKSFSVTPSAQTRRKHCSKECMGIARSINQKGRGRTRVSVQCEQCGEEFETKPSKLERGYGRFCSMKCQAQWQSEYRSGENSPTWRGGITPESRKQRNSKSYMEWRGAVFARDNWTCQDCGDRCGNGYNVVLHAHHILPFADFLEHRFDVSNGITLCVKCHRLNHPELNLYGPNITGLAESI